MDNFDLRKYLTENKLTRSSNSLNEVSIDMLKTQFVDTDKMDQKTFNDIVGVADKDSALITWMVSRVAGSKNVSPIIKKEDIYKFKNYFSTFKRNKGEYPLKDINMIKDKSDLNAFIKKSNDIADVEGEDISKQKGVSKEEKYKNLKIGEVDGYIIYKIPKGADDLYGASCEIGSGTD